MTSNRFLSTLQPNKKFGWTQPSQLNTRWVQPNPKNWVGVNPTRLVAKPNTRYMPMLPVSSVCTHMYSSEKLLCWFSDVSTDETKILAGKKTTRISYNPTNDSSRLTILQTTSRTEFLIQIRPTVHLMLNPPARARGGGKGVRTHQSCELENVSANTKYFSQHSSFLPTGHWVYILYHVHFVSYKHFTNLKDCTTLRGIVHLA